MSNTVSIIGGTIWGNRGAEAMLVTTVGEVRQRFPAAQVHIFSYLAKRDRSLLHDPSIEIHSSSPASLLFVQLPIALLCGLLKPLRIHLPDRLLPRSMRVLRASNVLLDISGIAFADEREKYLPFNVLIILPAMLLRIPVVKLSQALGPFERPVTRTISKLFLSRCQHIFARGKVTARHLEQLNLPQDKWELAADIAFLYRAEYSLSSENEVRVQALEAQLEKLNTTPRIALIPSSLVYEKSLRQGQDYVEAFVKLIRTLPTNDHFVLVPNATREGSGKPRNNDLFVIDLIHKQVAHHPDLKDRIHLIDYDVNTAATRRILKHCDVVVTSRFHGMISALSLCKPLFVIGWSHKYLEVLDEFELGEYSADFSDTTVDIPARIQELLDKHDAVATKIRHKLETIRTSSQRQFDWLRL
jgi:colanic acid/amylovoran biosynthesis protein